MASQSFRRRYSHQLHLCALVALLCLSACRTEEVDLSFEEIERVDSLSWASNYPEKVPAVIIVAAQPEIRQLEAWISPDAQRALHDLDFAENFAVAVFQGLKQTNGYGVEIQRIVRRDDTVLVHAHFTERNPRHQAGEVLTSPYHIVALSKEGAWDGRIRFVLLVGRRVVARRTHLFGGFTSDSLSSFRLRGGDLGERLELVALSE